jgi:hypothetical protein
MGSAQPSEGASGGATVHDKGVKAFCPNNLADLNSGHKVSARAPKHDHCFRKSTSPPPENLPIARKQLAANYDHYGFTTAQDIYVSGSAFRCAQQKWERD